MAESDPIPDPPIPPPIEPAEWNSSKRGQALQRRKTIMDLRCQGKKSIAQIAMIMGLSTARVRKIIHQEVEWHKQERGQVQDKHLENELIEIDRALELAWSIAKDPMKMDLTKLAALGHVEKLMTQKQRLLGLLQAKVDVTSGGSPMKFIIGINEDDI